MKKFKFNLNNVLKFRKIKEDNEKKAFGVLVNDLAKANDDLTMIQNQIVSAYETNEESTSIDELKSSVDFVSSSRAKAKEQEKLISHREESVSKQREILIHAVTKRKVIEKYKERRKKEYIKSRRKVENKFFDEIAQAKFHTKKKSD